MRAGVFTVVVSKGSRVFLGTILLSLLMENSPQQAL